MSVYVKICGITTLDDALACVEAGADALGFNFFPGSPRFIDWEPASQILQEVPPSIHRVGVFVDPDLQTVIDMSTDLNLDCVQLHGDESPEYCRQLARPWYKAFRLRSEEDLAAIASYDIDPQSGWVMVDAYSEKGRGGTGERARWDLALQAKQFGKVILAGGLTPDNVVSALEWVRPDAVDVASGVERSPGVKDHRKVEQLIEKVKAWSKR